MSCIFNPGLQCISIPLVTAAGWKGAHKDVEAPEEEVGIPREEVRIWGAPEKCFHWSEFFCSTCTMIMWSRRSFAVLDFWMPKAHELDSQPRGFQFQALEARGKGVGSKRKDHICTSQSSTVL